ncbi:MAG: D-glycero-alpha-D-manno-heptose 7-phosphate kinase [Anaerolineales bacterium]|nr:GHMP kinase [Anaerolineae bacterium]MBL8105398.1 GHMP kinase [Anaerolineales bacterium]MBV6401860.1 D-glycero-alpha-D-manno-heptose 7-phosphate kinase [Anaerolineales bacterium]MCC7190051.1 GHMP kinase [Anaerolineales bacterium]
MIIVQTPLRISFFGGGTDFPSFFMEEGGCVLSSAIDKYIFVTVKKRFDRKLRIGYTQTEMVDDVSQIHHEMIREALLLTGVSQGIEVTTMGDIPSEGSGLGSSSTVTVGAVHALHTYLGNIVTMEQLAREACDIEIGRLGKPIGIQDQYIAAYGNLRFFEFCPDGQVKVQKVILDADLRRELNDRFLLFFTGISRKADSVLTEQKSNIKDRMNVLREIRDMAYQAKSDLQAGQFDAFGSLLHQSWELKKRMAGQISNGAIDEMYDAARRAGAIGGKITGAGGGGFILLCAPHEKHQAIRQALNGLQELPFQLEPDGTKVIFNYRR